MSTVARYRFRSGSMTTDDSGNGNSLTNTNVTSVNIQAWGGAKFVKASSSVSTVPINFTKAAITTIMGIIRYDNTPAHPDTFYGTRKTTWGDSHRSHDFQTWHQYMVTRYDSGGNYITNIPWIVINKPITFAYTEDWAGGTYYSGLGGANSALWSLSYSNLDNLRLGCLCNNGVNNRYSDVSLADIQLFNNTITPAYFKNYLSLISWTL